MKNICINLGSNPGFQSIYTEKTSELARTLIGKGYNIVYGGADVGLMGTLANTALECGGNVIGVIPEKIKDKVAHNNLSELHVVKEMHERKMKMFELSDGFIALPGGFGTIEEIFEILTWAQLGYHSKPFGFLNINNYFKILMDFIENSVSEGFIKQEHKEMIIIEKEPDIIVEKLKSFKMPVVEKWINK